MQNLRCLIVDDEIPCRALMRRLISQMPDVQIVGESETVEQAISNIALLQPDVLLLDIQLGPESGFSIPSALDDPPPRDFRNRLRSVRSQRPFSKRMPSTTC
jgi:two-component system LytT family response regulator